MTDEIRKHTSRNKIRQEYIQHLREQGSDTLADSVEDDEYWHYWQESLTFSFWLGMRPIARLNRVIVDWLKSLDDSTTNVK